MSKRMTRAEREAERFHSYTPNDFALWMSPVEDARP